MKLTVLTENTTSDDRLQSEHGLSFFIEANGRKILFDTGQSSLFAKNAETLSVDLSQVDIAVLSHAHYDHGGGLATFLGLNDHAPVYVSQYAFDTYKNGTGTFVGIDNSLQKRPQVRLVNGDLNLGDGLQLLTGEGRALVQPIKPSGLSVRRNGTESPDDFRHEQYLLITQGKKRVLISGCSHKGIVNIMHWFTPDVMIGGLHLMKISPQAGGGAQLNAIGRDLLDFHTTYYVCHCTGEAQYAYLKRLMQDTLFYIATGQEIQL